MIFSGLSSFGTRPEAVEAGTVKLIGVEAGAIVCEAECLLHDAEAYRTRATAVVFYGDGHAAERIAGALIERSWEEN